MIQSLRDSPAISVPQSVIHGYFTCEVAAERSSDKTRCFSPRDVCSAVEYF